MYFIQRGHLRAWSTWAYQACAVARILVSTLILAAPRQRRGWSRCGCGQSAVRFHPGITTLRISVAFRPGHAHTVSDDKLGAEPTEESF